MAPNPIHNAVINFVTRFIVKATRDLLAENQADKLGNNLDGVSIKFTQEIPEGEKSLAFTMDPEADIVHVDT